VQPVTGTAGLQSARHAGARASPEQAGSKFAGLVAALAALADGERKCAAALLRQAPSRGLRVRRRGVRVSNIISLYY
jgi:hypothetical protein